MQTTYRNSTLLESSKASVCVLGAAANALVCIWVRQEAEAQRAADETELGAWAADAPAVLATAVAANPAWEELAAEVRCRSGQSLSSSMHDCKGVVHDAKFIAWKLSLMLCAHQVRKELQEAKTRAAADASAAAAAARAAAAASAPTPRKEPVQDGDAEQPEDAEAAADDPESEAQVCTYIHMVVRFE